MKFEFNEEERGIIAAGLRDFQARLEGLSGSCCVDEELLDEQWLMAEHLITYIVKGARV